MFTNLFPSSFLLKSNAGRINMETRRYAETKKLCYPFFHSILSGRKYWTKETSQLNFLI